MGICSGQVHENALQRQSAIPHSRANFPLRCGLRHLGQDAFYHQVGQSGGTYRAQRSAK